MTDALLVSDQCWGSTLLSPVSTGFPSEEVFVVRPRSERGYGSVRATVSFPSFGSEIGLHEQQTGCISGEWAPRQKKREEHRIPIAQLLEQLATRRRSIEPRSRSRDEIEWIANNRGRFAGRWVALSGGNLLATGASAREVFEAATRTESNPLVVYLEPEVLPFIGW